MRRRPGTVPNERSRRKDRPRCRIPRRGRAGKGFDELPPSVLVRECAELRHQLRLVLEAVAAAALTPWQRATALAALEDGATYRTGKATEWCDGCVKHPSGCCDRHLDDMDQADAYQRVAREIGGSR